MVETTMTKKGLPVGGLHMDKARVMRLKAECKHQKKGMQAKLNRNCNKKIAEHEFKLQQGNNKEQGDLINQHAEDKEGHYKEVSKLKQ